MTKSMPATLKSDCPLNWSHTNSFMAGNKNTKDSAASNAASKYVILPLLLNTIIASQLFDDFNLVYS